MGYLLFFGPITVAFGILTLGLRGLVRRRRTASRTWRRTDDTHDEVVPVRLFLRDPEPKAGKNRIHLDLRPDDQDAEVDRLEAFGARRIDVDHDAGVTWVVMADPESN